MCKKIEELKTYTTDLGKQLFPDHDFYSVRAQTRFSEAWKDYGKDIDSIEDFEIFLEHFTPEEVKSSIRTPNQFTKITVNNWEIDKSTIISRLKDHYALTSKKENY